MAALTDVEKKVLAALEHADGRVLSRADLAAITGYTDRQNRAAINILIVKSGIRIETAPNGGYFIPANDNPYTLGKKFVTQGFSLVSRGRKMLRLSQRAERLKLQVTLFGKKR